jgi:PAS domain S-box-containing protein
MMLKVYVIVVALVAAAVAAVAASSVHVTTPPQIGALVLMGGLVLVTEYLQLRQYHYRGHGAGLNLMEAVLVPLVVFAPGAEAMLVCSVALALADILRRMDPLKIVFNVAQWTLAAGLASLVVREASARTGHGTGEIALAVAAIVVMSVVNQLTMTSVLTLAARAAGQGQSREGLIAGFVGRGLSNVAALVAGLALVGAYRWSPWLVTLGFVFVVGLDAAGRANASLRADHIRLEGMQSATHALAASIDVASGLQAFLAETRTGFEVQVAELVLFSERGATVHRCTAAGGAGYAVCIERHPLAEAVASRLPEATRFAAGDGTTAGAILAGSDHTRVLAAPMRAGGTTIGVLFLYDRIGMEGFERGELKVADALTREVVSFLERVTLLQAIDEERNKLADILGNTSDGIFSIESDGTITSWNAGLAAMTGYVAEEIVGTRHFGLLRPRDPQGRDMLFERWADLIDTPGGLPSDVQIVSQSGQTLWLSCSYSRIPETDTRREVLVVVARNITQARELERLKDDFVAVVSHELRTPLVPIKGWAQTLLNRGDRLSEDQRRTAVQSILAQAQKLESLVLNILEASRIEAGRTDGDGVADIGGITARIVEDTLSSRPDRTLRLRPPSVPANVKGSGVWVERAVSNLVANAIKYSPDDEPVDVVISIEGNDVVVAVTDRGPGIAADAQERIFERFERLEESRKQTGTGLGLYITRRLARAMGGDVTVSSVPGAGSTFLLRLPSTPVALPSASRLPEQRMIEERDGNVVRLH